MQFQYDFGPWWLRLWCKVKKPKVVSYHYSVQEEKAPEAWKAAEWGIVEAKAAVTHAKSLIITEQPWVWAPLEEVGQGMETLDEAILRLEGQVIAQGVDRLIMEGK